MLVKSVNLKTNQITPLTTPVTITKATAMSSPKVKAVYLVHYERLTSSRWSAHFPTWPAFHQVLTWLREKKTSCIFSPLPYELLKSLPMGCCGAHCPGLQKRPFPQHQGPFLHSAISPLSFSLLSYLFVQKYVTHKVPPQNYFLDTSPTLLVKTHP